MFAMTLFHENKNIKLYNIYIFSLSFLALDFWFYLFNVVLHSVSTSYNIYIYIHDILGILYIMFIIIPYLYVIIFI